MPPEMDAPCQSSSRSVAATSVTVTNASNLSSDGRGMEVMEGMEEEKQLRRAQEARRRQIGLARHPLLTLR